MKGVVRKTISVPIDFYDAAEWRQTNARINKFSSYIQELIKADQQRGILGPANPAWANCA